MWVHTFIISERLSFTHRIRYSDAHVMLRKGLAVNTVPSKTIAKPAKVSMVI
jgi:hypothetical protein